MASDSLRTLGGHRAGTRLEKGDQERYVWEDGGGAARKGVVLPSPPGTWRGQRCV